MPPSTAKSGSPQSLGRSGAERDGEANSRRERMILEHLPQVRLIARQFHTKVAGYVSLEDLVSTGTLGLIAAIDNFRVSQGVKLKTYSEHRIRGAILDSLRSFDLSSRVTRRRARRIENTVRCLEQRLLRRPTAEEVAAENALSIEQYHAHMAETRSLRWESLETRTGSNQTLGSSLPDQRWDPAPAAIERAERERWLRSAVDAMPELNRTVLVLSYFEELTRREVAARMGIDASQVTRLKWHSIVHLRARMGNQLRSRARRPHNA